MSRYRPSNSRSQYLSLKPVDLRQITLVVGCFVNQIAAAVDLDVVPQPFQQGMVHAARNVGVVADFAVGQDDLRERVTHPVGKIGRPRGAGDVVDIVHVLRGDIGEVFRAEGEIGIALGIQIVVDHLQRLGLVRDQPRVRESETRR